MTATKILSKTAIIGAFILCYLPAWAENGKSVFSDGPYNPSENALVACSEYGPDYYRIGKGSCFRIGGSVRAEALQRSSTVKNKTTNTKTKYRRSSQRTSGYVELDVVADTGFGPARIVMRKGVEFGNNR